MVTVPAQNGNVKRIRETTGPRSRSRTLLRADMADSSLRTASRWSNPADSRPRPQNAGWFADSIVRLSRQHISDGCHEWCNSYWRRRRRHSRPGSTSPQYEIAAGEQADEIGAHALQRHQVHEGDPVGVAVPVELDGRAAIGRRGPQEVVDIVGRKVEAVEDGLQVEQVAARADGKVGDDVEAVEADWLKRI